MDRDAAGGSSITNCTTRKIKNGKTESTGLYYNLIINNKVSYSILLSNTYIMIIQVYYIPDSKTLADNQEEEKELTREKESKLQYC